MGYNMEHPHLLLVRTFNRSVKARDFALLCVAFPWLVEGTLQGWCVGGGVRLESVEPV